VRKQPTIGHVRVVLTEWFQSVRDVGRRHRLARELSLIDANGFR
jgi:hypothetical protein